MILIKTKSYRDFLIVGYSQSYRLKLVFSAHFTTFKVKLRGFNFKFDHVFMSDYVGRKESRFCVHISFKLNALIMFFRIDVLDIYAGFEPPNPSILSKYLDLIKIEKMVAKF